MPEFKLVVLLFAVFIMIQNSTTSNITNDNQENNLQKQ